MRKSIASALAVFALAAIATPVAAEETTVAVSYKDLNLLNPEGVARLESRIRRAVREVCGEIDRRNAALGKSWNECRKRTQQQANVQVARAIERERTLALAAMLENGRRG